MRRTTLNAHYTHASYAGLIWDALGQLGFSQGRVLEPGCGSGNFIGLAPDGAALTGVERDPVTAAIAAHLYPQASIRAESFADTRIPSGYFDAAVGNVPFGKFKLSDPAHNPGRRLSIHNHFIVKSLELTRPGGMVALLTSRYTMDARNPEARRRIAALGDLVAAIRLPAGAHRQAAGTDVVTDLLILRRREPGQPGEPDGWELAPETDLPGGPARVNEYFTAHPELVLGEMRTGHGAHGENDVIVDGPPDASAALAAALETAVTRARASGLTITSRPETAGPAPLPPLVPSDDQIDGLIQAHPDGTFTRLASGALHPYEPPATQATELRQLIGLRDTVLALLRAEAASPDDTEEVSGLRAELNAGYQDYLDRYGPVKRFTWASSGRIDPQTGQKAQSKRRPPQGGFRDDPLYTLVYALEESYDPTTKTAVRADIFTQRVVVPEAPMLGADTADEALAICLNNYGEVRLEEITRLLGAGSDAEARAELGTLVFDEPGTGRLIWAPLYLSGDVRAKLAAAEGAAAADPRFEANAAALRAVVPRDLGPAEIEAQLGAGWIAPQYVQQFLRETLGDGSVTVERNRSRKWKVSGGNRKSVAATSTWGTHKACAHDLAQRLLTGTAEQIKVTYEVDGAKVIDHEATEAAKQKARELADRFSIWTWEDTGRTRDLARVYNDRYNAVVPVSFDGVRLLTPGLSAALTLRGHQPPAIARVIYQGSAGLVHDTGAGKTLETIIGVRERQRLGLSHKPCFVVQKNKVGDFAEEFLRAYPDARLLVADTKDLTGTKRREFIARCATGNPTAIIMSREAFRSIPVSAERIAAFLKDEEIALEIAIEDAQKSGEDDRTIKQIEAELENTKERRKEQVAKIGQDRGLCYEDTGIDYLVLDEARAYRKGPIISSLPGMADPGSARALDLLLKLGYHHDLYGETRVCLADATPFTNRISEIYTWLRYLHYDIEPFDDWTRTFGKMAVAYEMLPGGDFKAKARLREIINAVDLHLWLREANDFKLKDSLDLKLPVMAGGKPQIVQVPASDELLAYADRIRWRYEHLPKGPPKKGEDNHLKVQGDAIKAALDLRLVGRSTSQPQKVDVTADVVYDKWLTHRDDVYQRADGTEHPVRGSLILVFASLGTPGRTRKLAEGEEPGPYDNWDFYTQLRANLIDRGMPGHLVKFMHEADNEQRLEELFHGARNGEVHVLVGSTEKLGIGVNVQDRCVGMVQVTAPWNWDEPHQELGRVERQGNQNDEFFCIRVVTTPSADAIKWERARQKEQSFRALMSGKIEGRTIRIPDDDLSSAEMMAAASGDMRLLERAELEGTLSRLDRLRRAWAQQQTGLGYTIGNAEDQIAGKKRAIAMIDAALGRRKGTRADAFAMTVAGQRYAKRAEAADRLREVLLQQIAATPRGHVERGVALGEIGGFTLTATLAPQFANSITLTLDGIPDLPSPLALNHRELPEKAGIITRLENRLAGLEQARSDAEAAIGHLDSEIEQACASIGGAFPQQDEYDHASDRLKALEADLVGPSEGPAESQPAGEGTAPESATPDAGSRRAPAGRTATPEGSGPAWQPAAAELPQPARPDTGRPPVPAQPDAEAGSPGQDAIAAVDGSRAGEQHAVRPDAAPERAALAPGQPVGDEQGPQTGDGPADGLVIEHHQQGTLIHGTGKDDQELRRLLHQQGFKWSGNLGAWYLPRPWGYSTRDRRVTGLTTSLHQAHRSFTMRRQQPAPEAADDPAPDALPASRTRATAQDPAAWAAVFAEVPGNAPATDPGAAAPDAAEPTTGSSPEPGPSTAEDEQAQPEERTAGTASPATTAGPPASAPEAPASGGSASELRQLAAAHGLSIDTGQTGTRGATLTVVHDDGRTVLLHDDISGTRAGGYRLSPGEVAAYLAAYSRYPHLPPRCLADVMRHDPDEPSILTLTAAREAAARHGLEVRIRRARGQSYITVCEPGVAGPPVLSYLAEGRAAVHGPCTVPVAAIDSYLLAYRDSVPAAMFTVPAAPQDWGRRVAQLTPHLVDGSGHFIRGARNDLRAALTAARDGHLAEADIMLTQAERATPPLTPAPDRDAELTAVISQHAWRYGHAEDPAAYLAGAVPQLIDASDREWDWARSYIAAHPGVREHAAPDGPAATGQPDGDREAAADKARQAKTALEDGDYERSLALIDEAELLYPNRGVRWDAGRDQVRAAMSQLSQPQDVGEPRPPAEEDGARTGTDSIVHAATEPVVSGDGPGAQETAAAQDVDGRGQGTLSPSGETSTEQPARGHAAEPDSPGRYSSRIRVSFESGPPTVSGTSYQDDPAELREALRANGFTWRKQRQVWEYTGSSTGRLEAVAAIRDVLARLDREPATPSVKEFPPTPQQQAILDAFLQGKDIAVQALAGTGKTTTLVLLARALMDRSPDAQVVYTAFNADIVADARRGRFGRNVTAMTMHSIAKQALLQTSYAGKVNNGDQGARWPEQWASVLEIPDITASGSDPVPAEAVARLVIATVRKFRESADDKPGRQHLPSNLSSGSSPLARAVLSYARKAWADIADPGNAALMADGRALRVDHDDYLKVWALSRPRISAQVIFFDEAQDVNAVMRRVILDQPAQTIVVGDSHQSIYGFRGAIDALKDWPADIVLPLTQSWRFGPDAAEFGNLFLRSLDSSLLLEGNPALATRLGRADKPDAILCRTNATAVAEVFAGLESGKRVALAGGGQAIREIAKAARDLQAGRGTRHPDLSRFADWDEVRHYAQHEEDGKSLQVFVRLVDRHGPDGLIDMIGRLTPEADAKNPPQLTISTAHKAKGRQWPTVRIAGDFRGPVTDPETGDVTWPAPEERRLAYVAATRAQLRLETGSLSWINDYAQAQARDQAAAPEQAAARLPEPAVASPQPQPAPAPTPAPEAADADSAKQPVGPDMAIDYSLDGGQTWQHGAIIDGPAAASTETLQQQRRIVRDRARREHGNPSSVTTRILPASHPGRVLTQQPAPSSGTQAAVPDTVPAPSVPEAPPPPGPATAASQPSPITAAARLDSAPGGSQPDQSSQGPVASEAAIQSEPSAPESPGEYEPEPSPVNNSDLAIALCRLPGFTPLLTQAGTPPHGGSRDSRRDGEPNAGAYQALDSDSNGIEITINGPSFRRHGRLAWPQVASWIDAGVTPARLGIIVTADRLGAFCRSRRDELAAAGRCDPDAAASELDQIRDDTTRMVIDAALRTRGAAAPVPAARPGKPAYYTAAMITRPDPAASREENATLERLTQLRAAIREQQPITAEEVKAEIRRWIGDGLPGYVRALGKPVAMRAWISRQASGPAGRLVRVTYDTPGVPGGRWHGASPEGLLTAVGNDDRAETLIPWEEIPAWVQPGITSSLRDRLTGADDAHTALVRRRLTAAVHLRASLTAPSDQDDEQATRPLREAIADAWAAIEAAPPPVLAHLEAARRTYRDTSPVQQTLFGDPPEASQQGRGEQPRPTPPPQPAGSGTSLSTDDILIGLSRLPAFVIGDLISAMDGSEPLDSVYRQLAPWSGERQPGEPDAGAPETVTAEPAGLRITVNASSGSRMGLLVWAEAADRLRPGLTAARRQVVAQAARAALRFAAANASFRAVGEGGLAAAAEEELRGLARAAVTAMLSDARPAGNDHPARPARHENEARALERISELATALPGRRPQARTPVSQVKAGDIIGHPAYKLQPFRLSAPPRHLDGQVEITGRLTAPSDGEPAGQITFTLPPTRNTEPVVVLIPIPQRSLRALFPVSDSEGGTCQGQDPDRGAVDLQASDGQPLPEPSRRQAHATVPAGQPGVTAEDTAPTARAPGAPANPGSPQGDMPHATKEDTMPSVPADASRESAAISRAADEKPTALASPPSASEPAGEASAEDGTRQGRPAGQPGDGSDLLGELDRVLDAIIERRRGADRQDGGTRDDFTDIRAAFTLLRNALDIGSPAGIVTGFSPRSGAMAPDLAGDGRAAPEPARGSDPGPGEFDDIRSAFTELRRVLDLPAGGRHARGSAPPSDPSASQLLDQAAEEAQACARWYRDTPEWQRITTIGRAARELIGAIREAAKDYWAEIRQDIRVRGFARTLAARVCLGVSGAARVLASRLERGGRGNTRTWRAAWGLHQATANFADRIMRYTPPRSPDRMTDARRIIDDLSTRQRSEHAPMHAVAGAGPEPAHAPDPVRLARVSFTGQAHPAAVPLAEPAHRVEAQAGHRRRAGHGM